MIHRLIIKDQFSGDWLSFEDCRQVITAGKPGEVLRALKQVEQQVEQQSYYAAGFLEYEAASGFDAALVSRDDLDLKAMPDDAGLPLLAFGLFKSIQRYSDVADLDIKLSEQTSADLKGLDWQLEMSTETYLAKIARIKAEIAAGTSYQVNFTLRQNAEADFSAWQMFKAFAVDAPYAAYIEYADVSLCCASPELFFSRDQNHIRCRPMKGTAPRGKTFIQDIVAKKKLEASLKDRAENVMIVDMVRNDLGRIADLGSVSVSKQFAVEKYPTLWQMTTSIEARSQASLTDLFSALFPCASITGAPKVETMKLISQLEQSRRGIYSGSIGYLMPTGQAQFNVAIRTATVKGRQISYGIGGGIVWDSRPEEEYAECLLKSNVVRGKAYGKDFSLLESLLWNRIDGYFLLSEHLQRLHDSADYFDISFDAQAVKQALLNHAATLQGNSLEPIDSPERINSLEPINRPERINSLEPINSPERVDHKVRLLINQCGDITLTSELIESETETAVKKIALADKPVLNSDVFLYHKTSQRAVYLEARRPHEQLDDVILWNTRGELTESTICNLVLKLDGKFCTPPIHSGLLAGTFRQYLLQEGHITEKTLYKNDLVLAEEIWLINSVRRWQAASFVGRLD